MTTEIENARADYLSICRWTHEMALSRRGFSTVAEVAKLRGKWNRLVELVGAAHVAGVIEGR